MKKNDVNIVKQIITDNNNSTGFLKRKPENEVGYMFGGGKPVNPFIKDVKNTSFNVRYFSATSGIVEIGPDSFTWDKDYVTYTLETINGNAVDANLNDNVVAMYSTEIFSRTVDAIRPKIRLFSVGQGQQVSGAFKIYINDTFYREGALSDGFEQLDINIPKNEFVRITIFIRVDTADTNFEIGGEWAFHLESWRFPLPVAPEWETGYPSSRTSQHDIELKWINKSIYSVGDTARTVIEYSTSENGEYTELAYVDYDTKYFCHSSLPYGTIYWYRLKVVDNTASQTNYCDAKEGSTLPGSFPSLEIRAYKGGEQWDYCKSGDTIDIHVISNTALASYPEAEIRNATIQATGNTVFYGTDELNAYSTYTYTVVSGEDTQVSGGDNIFPEGSATIYALGNIFGTTENNVTNYIANASLEQRYLVTGDNPYVMISGWTVTGNGARYHPWLTVSHPKYVYEHGSTGKMGSRYIRCGGPADYLQLQNGVGYYSDTGASFLNIVSGAGIIESGEYSLSFYSRISQEYSVNSRYEAHVTGWQPKVICNFIETGGSLVYTYECIGTGSTDWKRHFFTIPSGDIPADIESVQLRFTSEKTVNYACDGSFIDSDFWWTATDATLSGNISDVDSPTGKCGHLVTTGTSVLSPSGWVPMDDVEYNDVTISLDLKSSGTMGGREIVIHCREKTNTGFGAWTSGSAYRQLNANDWSTAHYIFPSGGFSNKSIGIDYKFSIPSGDYRITSAMVTHGSGNVNYAPGDLHIEYDAPMFVTGSVAPEFRTSETEYGVWSIGGDNVIYFDYTAPTGSMYVSAVAAKTSNLQQPATTDFNNYVILTGPDGTGSPYDANGIRYVYIINSGDCAPVDDPTGTGTWTRFDYNNGAPYVWTIDVSGAGAIGISGTGPRKVYCKLEDMAGNVSEIYNDTIIYMSGMLPAPQGVSATGRLAGTNRITWEAYDDTYGLLKRYEVYGWESSPQLGDPDPTSSGIFAMYTSSTGTDHNGVESATDYYYAVRMRDVSDNAGNWSDIANCTSISYVDGVAPPEPFVSGLAENSQVLHDGSYYCQVLCEIGHTGGCSDLKILQCGIRLSGEEEWRLPSDYVFETVPTGDDFPVSHTFVYSNLLEGSGYEFSGRARDMGGTWSDWCTPSGITISTDSTPPGVVENFELDGLYRKVLANWDLMEEWDAQDFIILRGDYSPKTSGTINAAVDNRIYVSSLDDIDIGYMMVLDPGGGNEGRFIISDTGATPHIDLFGNVGTYTPGDTFAVFKPVDTPLRGPWTDQDMTPSTTYYYNILARDIRNNISTPYVNELSLTGYDQWTSVTTLGVNEVGMEWNFIAEATTINKLKNSNFVIQSGANSTDAAFWISQNLPDYYERQQQDFALFGDYVCMLDHGSVTTQEFTIANSGDHVLSFYVRQEFMGDNTIEAAIQYTTNGGQSWNVAETMTTGCEYADTWYRYSLTGDLDPATMTTSGRVSFTSYVGGSDQWIDGIQMQEGSLTQYVPYSDEFILGTELITNVEITSGTILARNIAANAIEAKHILAGAIGTHHLTVANRETKFDDIEFRPNRNYPGPYDDDTDWDTDSIFWTSGTVHMQSGESPVGTSNSWVQLELASGAYVDVGYDEYTFVCFDFEITASGEPVGGGDCAIRFISGDSIGDTVLNPAVSGRLLIGHWLTGTGETDEVGGTYESYQTMGTTIDGEHIKTGSITARLIKAGAIIAEHIGADEINGTHIQAGSIDAGHISVGARPRAYAHNCHIELKNHPSLGDYVRVNAGSLFTSGAEYSVPQYDVFQAAVSDDTFYYLYYKIEPADEVGITGENFDLLTTGDMFPIATIIKRTDTNVASFEITPIYGYGTYIDGSNLFTESITATQIAANAIVAGKIDALAISGANIIGDSIDAGHILADAIETVHFSGELIEAVSFHADTNGQEGELWINSGGTANGTCDIRVYDNLGNPKVTIGYDVIGDVMSLPANVTEKYGVVVASGHFIANNRDWHPEPERANVGFHSYAVGGDAWDGGSQHTSYRGFSSYLMKDYSMSEDSNTNLESLIGYTAWIENTGEGINDSDVGEPQGGIKGIRVYVKGDGNPNEKMRMHHSSVVFDSTYGVTGGANVGGVFVAEKVHGTGKQQGDIVGVFGLAHGVYDNYGQSSSDHSVLAGGVFVGTKGDGSESTGYLYGPAYSIICWGDERHDGAGSAPARIVYGSGATLFSEYEESPLKIGQSGGGIAKVQFVPTGEILFASGNIGPKITVSDEKIYIPSGIKIDAGQTINLGTKEIKEIDGKIEIASLSKITASGIYPSGTVDGTSTLGRPEVGKEWHSLYLNSGDGGQPGVFWNYSAGPTQYAGISARNDAAYSRLSLYQFHDGSKNAKFILDGEEEEIYFHGDFIPETSGEFDVGSSSKTINRVYADHIYISGEAVSAGAGGASAHNDLTDIQGGTTNEYYHLTSSEYTNISGLDQSVNTDSDVTFNDATVDGNLDVKNNITISGDLDVGGDYKHFHKTLVFAKNVSNQTSDLWPGQPGNCPGSSNVGYYMRKSGSVVGAACHLNMNSYNTNAILGIEVYASGVLLWEINWTVDKTGWCGWASSAPKGTHTFNSGDMINVKLDMQTATSNYGYPCVDLDIILDE